MSKDVFIGWSLFVFITLCQSVVLAIWPDVSPVSTYLYGTIHGAIWIYVLSVKGVA